MSISDVRKLENLLKRQKGGVGLYKITGLSDLSIRLHSGSEVVRGSTRMKAGTATKKR